MYTVEQLESETFIDLYKRIGKESYDKIMEAEAILIGKSINKKSNEQQRDFNINIGNMTFTYNENGLHYHNKELINDDGTYLITDIVKEKDENLLEIDLTFGVEGFDLATGERFDRKRANVKYSYSPDLLGLYSISSIKDEEYFDKQEEERKKQVAETVARQKK